MEAKTRVTLGISSPEHAGASYQIDLADEFETVFNKLFPIQPATSQLEHRMNMQHRKADGGIISIQPMTIITCEEIVEEE